MSSTSEINLAGVTYDNRQEFLSTLKGIPTECSLVHEPDNDWNKDAIAIYVGETKVGYAYDNICKDLLECLDGIKNSIIDVYWSEEYQLFAATIKIEFKEEEDE